MDFVQNHPNRSRNKQNFDKSHLQFEENKFNSKTVQDMNGQNNLGGIGIPNEKTVSRMGGGGGDNNTLLKTNMYEGESATTPKRIESGEKQPLGNIGLKMMNRK